MENINHFLPLLGIVMMRPLGAMLLLPIFSSAMLGGALIRNALIMVFILPIWPVLLQISVPSPELAPLPYTQVLFSELILGLLLGFCAAIPLWALDMAGVVIDTMRGASMGAIFNPLMSSPSSPTGLFLGQLAASLFVSGGGLAAWLDCLYHSYLVLPPGQSWHWQHGFLPLLQQQWQQLYRLMLGFAMPAIIIMVLVDLALGFINRAAQQINVFTLSMPIKSILVLIMLMISLLFVFSPVSALFNHFHGGLLLKVAADG